MNKERSHVLAWNYINNEHPGRNDVYFGDGFNLLSYETGYAAGYADAKTEAENQLNELEKLRREEQLARHAAQDELRALKGGKF